MELLETLKLVAVGITIFLQVALLVALRFLVVALKISLVVPKSAQLSTLAALKKLIAMAWLLVPQLMVVGSSIFILKVLLVVPRLIVVALKIYLLGV